MTTPKKPPILPTLLKISSTGLASWFEAVHAAPMRFFCAYCLAFYYVGLGGALARVAGASPVCQLRSVRLPMIGIVWGRFTTYPKSEAIMNNSTQRAVSALFYILLNGQTFSQNLDWFTAHDFKAAHPQAVIKFQAFKVGGVA